MSIQESETRCPHCGQRLPPTDVLVVGGRERQQIVNLLVEHPRGLTRNELIDEIYGGGDKICNPNTISVMVNVANTLLIDQGWIIRPAHKSRDHRYVLERLETVATA